MPLEAAWKAALRSFQPGSGLFSRAPAFSAGRRTFQQGSGHSDIEQYPEAPLSAINSGR